MSKIILLLVISSLCLVKAQTGRRTCERVSRECVANQARLGLQDDVTKYLNADCRRRNPRWRNVTICQMKTASCSLSLVSCRPVNCANIAMALRR